MQPSGKRRLAPKGCDLAKELQEGFLGEILGFRGVSHHPQDTGHRRAGYAT